jgi:hypothetical protein
VKGQDCCRIGIVRGKVSFLLLAVFCVAFSPLVFGDREAVLKQIDLPHPSYFFKELKRYDLIEKLYENSILRPARGLTDELSSKTFSFEITCRFACWE